MLVKFSENFVKDPRKMWRRGKLTFIILSIEVIIIIIFTLNVDYNEHADGSDPIHSNSPAFSGLDPEENLIESNYHSKCCN